MDQPRPENILKLIIERKRAELMRLTYQSNPWIGSRPPDSTRDFFAAVSAPTDDLNLIAEFKRTTPFRTLTALGQFRKDALISQIIPLYQSSGARAISVLADSGFNGSLSDVYIASQHTSLPVLCKEFIIHASQIPQARYFGADAVLLMANVLSPYEMKACIDACHEYGMTAVIETHTRAEMEKLPSILAYTTEHHPNPKIVIGINNRNMSTGSESLDTTIELIQHAPEGSPLITESGIHTAADVRRLAPYFTEKLSKHDKGGAMLVGSALMGAADIGAKVQELAYAGRKVK